MRGRVGIFLEGYREPALAESRYLMGILKILPELLG